PNQGELASGRASFLAAVASAAPDAIPARRARRPLLRGWSLAAACALLLAAASGLVAAESGPGQPFYGLRLALGSLTVPGDEPAHERALAGQLDDRLSEVGAAARIGDGRGALAAIHEYLNTLRELTRNPVTDPEIVALIQLHENRLQQLMAVAPAQATDGVQQAIDAAGKVSGVVPPTQTAVPHATPQPGEGQSPPATGKP
ncbi:MAG: hypothetical protein ACXWMN_04850, partial [Candidatus Limnocylindria bacterium]